LVTHHYQDGMPDNDLRYCPSCTNGPDACGSTGTEWTTPWSEWKPWYEAAGQSIAHFSPGEEVTFRFTITADHGGQAWMMLSCNDSAAEDNVWYFMNRAASDTRGRLPSNPAIYAWPMAANDGVVTHVVPEGFSCPNGRGIGRWLWKAGNSCNDPTTTRVTPNHSSLRSSGLLVACSWANVRVPVRATILVLAVLKHS